MGEFTNIPLHDPGLGSREVSHARRVGSNGGSRRSVFCDPFDLIPDCIPLFGLIDDAGVIGCVARANLAAISNLRKWEILFGPFARH